MQNFAHVFWQIANHDVEAPIMTNLFWQNNNLKKVIYTVFSLKKISIFVLVSKFIPERRQGQSLEHWWVLKSCGKKNNWIICMKSNIWIIYQLFCLISLRILFLLYLFTYHGVGGRFLVRFNWPSSDSRYCFSSFEMNGWDPGLL